MSAENNIDMYSHRVMILSFCMLNMENGMSLTRIQERLAAGLKSGFIMGATGLTGAIVMSKIDGNMDPSEILETTGILAVGGFLMGLVSNVDQKVDEHVEKTVHTIGQSAAAYLAGVAVVLAAVRYGVIDSPSLTMPQLAKSLGLGTGLYCAAASAKSIADDKGITEAVTDKLSFRCK